MDILMINQKPYRRHNILMNKENIKQGNYILSVWELEINAIKPF
jgi:hypothetical protein